jgi:hypothetical protein
LSFERIKPEYIPELQIEGEISGRILISLSK